MRLQNFIFKKELWTTAKKLLFLSVFTFTSFNAYTTLLLEIIKADDKKVKNLVENWNAKNRNELHTAAKDGDHKRVKELIATGADVNAKDKQGWTPLHHTIANNSLFFHWFTALPHNGMDGRLQIIDLLLEHGADVNAKNNKGQTPLHIARESTEKVAKSLIENGADVHAKDNIGQTALYQVKNSEVAKALIDKGANINERDFQGMTPLHYASQYGWTEVAKALTDKGANINERDNNGKTPLYYAIFYKQTEVFDVFVKFIKQKNLPDLFKGLPEKNLPSALKGFNNAQDFLGNIQKNLLEKEADLHATGSRCQNSFNR